MQIGAAIVLLSVALLVLLELSFVFGWLSRQSLRSRPNVPAYLYFFCWSLFTVGMISLIANHATWMILSAIAFLMFLEIGYWTGWMFRKDITRRSNLAFLSLQALGYGILVWGIFSLR